MEGWSFLLPILLFVLCAGLLAVGLLAVGTLIGPRRSGAVKEMPYESGMDPIHDTRRRFDVRFHLVAVAFLLFDVEGAFFFPWALVYRESLAASGTLLLALSVYMGLLVLGLVYIFRKDALQID